MVIARGQEVHTHRGDETPDIDRDYSKDEHGIDELVRRVVREVAWS